MVTMPTMSEEIIGVLMPTVATVFPEVHAVIKKWVQGRKLNDSLVLTMAMLEMQAKISNHQQKNGELITEVAKLVKEHEGNSQKLYTVTIDVLKGIRSDVQDLKMKP